MLTDKQMCAPCNTMLDLAKGLIMAVVVCFGVVFIPIGLMYIFPFVVILLIIGAVVYVIGHWIIQMFKCIKERR